jgi:malonate transporter MadM subunit
MSTILEAFYITIEKNSFIAAFACVGATIWLSYMISDRLTRGRLHGSAIAIAIGLFCAALGGWWTGGRQGVADLPMLSGMGLMGGAMLRDLAIVATAFGVKVEEFRKGGVIGAVSLALGLLISFLVGGMVAFVCGYRDAESITTIGAGAATYIVGPVTGTAIGASGEVIALSFAAGLIKAISVMILTPMLAKPMGLRTPRAAMIYGGLMGTNSGVMAGLAATDPKLVPYGAMTATFYTGLGCLVGPSIVYLTVRLFF